MHSYERFVQTAIAANVVLSLSACAMQDAVERAEVRILACQALTE
jgi:hypothetical protein